jgi:hypothetical protein
MLQCLDIAGNLVSIHPKYIATIQTKVEAKDVLVGASGMGHLPPKSYIRKEKEETRPSFLEKYFYGNGSVVWDN